MGVHFPAGGPFDGGFPFGVTDRDTAMRKNAAAEKIAADNYALTRREAEMLTAE